MARLTRRFGVPPWLLALAGCLGAGGSADLAAVEETSFVRHAGLVFLEVERTGEAPLLALLDTGANASAIDPARSRALPVLETVEVLGTTGTLAAELVELRGLALAGHALPALRATRRDLSGLLAPEGARVEMILGSDAFVGSALTLDFERSVLELSASTAEAPDAADTSEGQAATEEQEDGVPLVLDQGIPAIPATLGGIETWLRLDTGASLFDTPDVYVNVPPRLWDELRARQPALAPTTHLRGTGADGGEVQLPVVPLEGAVVGPRPAERVFLIVQPAQGYFALPEAKGFVGNNYLEKLGRVTLDYGAGRLRVERPK